MANYPETIPASYAQDAALRDAYSRGWNHGHGIACHNVPSIGDKVCRSVDYVGLGSTVTAENIAEYHAMLCHAAADNSRCYSPFEFTAAEFNRSDDHEELWEAFEEGTGDAIAADLEGYSYGDDD